MSMNLFSSTLVCFTLFSWLLATPADVFERVEHRYASNDGVKIHYVTLGKGPVVVMLHGFPDFWYSWRDQIEALAGEFKVAAIDLRGYNQSDKPEGVQQYAMPLLVSDVVSVLDDLSVEKATVVGHDWGGAIAWNLAMAHPDRVERLIILNLPHPRGLMRELANNPEQQANSQYARDFQKEGAHLQLTAEGLAGWVQDPEARQRYIKAFQRSNFEAMLNYYKANYPREPYDQVGQFPPVRVSTLIIHGLQDRYLLAPALNDTWEWIDADLTLVTIPEAGHFVQQDASELVSRTMRMWLKR